MTERFYNNFDVRGVTEISASVIRGNQTWLQKVTDAVSSLTEMTAVIMTKVRRMQTDTRST